MASLRQSSFSGVCSWCCVISLVLHTFLSVTSATDVIRFNQGGKTDSDNIYDILEDEQFVIADKKLTRHKTTPHVTRTVVVRGGGNTSSSLLSSPYSPKSPPSHLSSSPLKDSGSHPVAAATSPQARTTTTSPKMHQPGYTPHAGAEPLLELEEELEEDFLIFSQDRERVEEGEERRREEERELARRVRRQAPTEGSGQTTADVQITTNIPWNANFLIQTSQDYINLVRDAESAIQAELTSMTPYIVTVMVTGFLQGSTVILCTVDFGASTVDRQALAREMLQLQANGLTYQGTAYQVTKEPRIESDSSSFEPSTCYLCASYQMCVQQNGTENYYCQLKSTFLFDFGVNQGDKTLAKDNKRLSIVEKVPGGIPVANERVKKVALSMNGLISFGKKFNSFNARTLPRGNRLLLCGYWADLLLSSSDSKSNVWYHVYEKTENMLAVDEAMLARGRGQVELYAARTDFDPTFMLVATFEEIPPDPSDAINTTERVNFQMAVISDGFSTYAMLIYVAGGMQWDENINRKVTIGYNTENLKTDVRRPDQALGNTNNRGVWFFMLGETTENPERSCLNWYMTQVGNRLTYQQQEQQLPACPCNYFAMLFSFDYFPYSLQDGVLCFMLIPSPQYNPLAKTCCYRSPGVLIRSRPYAGTFLLNQPDINAADHYRLDEKPKDDCCFQSQLCALYYDVRPTGACSRTRIIIIAIGRGDPHITTLDGNSFPFNAIGEFRLFKSMTFELQGRTCQAVSMAGAPVAASIFCAFVAKGNNSETLQVELSRSGESLVVYVNRQDLTTIYNTEGNSFQRSVGGMTITRSNDTLKATFSSGISMNITVAFKLLTYEMAVEQTVVNPTGLLGNLDGNPDNDYIFPNGTVLPNTTSERDLLAYGKTWAITDATSNFQYEAGRDTASYTNDSFVPIFLSEVNQTVRAQAESVCGGAGDIGCVFDYIATGDESLALGTKTVKEQVDANVQTAKNGVPEVTGPTRINVTLNEQTSFALNATDPEDPGVPTYVIVDQPSSNFAFDNNTQTAVWTPTSNDTSRMEFVVRDSTGASSPSLQIQIVQCSGCNNRGTCNFEEVREQTTIDEYFQIAVCDCQPYYSGDDCEDNFDACAEEPCPLLTTCYDFSIAEHIAAGSNSSGYNCSNCPTGYSLSISDGDIPSCYDVDECLGTPCASIATCTNTEGSYVCTCPSGYRLDTTDVSVCNDINECTENTDNCEQTCVNTDGGFNCSCLNGFTLNATTGNTCDKDQDPCATITNQCSYACQNASGVAQCVCPSGYQLAADQFTCTDVNECDQNLCSQKCANSDGSYTCSCFPGYQLDDDKITCNACPTNQYGEGCNQTCECRGRGTCDSVRGCQCDGGWTGVSCSQDVDECVTQVNPCPDTQLCVNNNGSFVCNCPTGYAKTDSGSCTDINECANPALHNCDQVCSNTLGSFVCSCTSGYTYVPANNTCVDVDECAEGISQCDQLCENFPGSANCACQQGFVLDDDRKTCTKERDPCEVLSDTKSCEYGCRVVNGSAQCYCRSGYFLATDGISCVDVNECSSNQTNKCSQTCDNTPGSYQCSCSTGFSLENDQRTCAVCDQYHWGPNCANDCNCSPLNTERCDPVTGCVCKSGWLGATCEQDRDECTSSPCPANSQCTDVAGSYRCDCLTGYSRATESDPCTDVNECNNNPCDQSCNNTVGSYVCSCDNGFTSDGDKCNDIDECLTNPCDQICRNTVGGYSCECYPGYLLNTTTRNTCYGQTVCLSNNTCSQGCRIVNAVETCFCQPGYQRNAGDPTQCDDVNECLSSPCTNGYCNNFDGSFNCSCSVGTRLLSDGLTCQACSEGKYGKDCAFDCTCNTDTTQTCVATSGSCTCLGGWQGMTCSDDINECAANASICAHVSNSQCVNSNGSFVCQCDVGFSTSGGQCLPCDDTLYGPECSNLCPCARANTLNCDDVNGTCTCNAFWKGENCTVDIDECSDNPNICNTTQFETCRNFDGGYACDCISGYQRPSPQSSCADVNECLYPNLNTCDATKEVCTNTNGSFHCQCAQGYNGSAGSCTDLNECSDPALNTCNERQDCNNTVGSYTCQCKSTYTLINGICTDINECSQDSLNNCTSKEDCVNTVGGYTCVCKSGYTRSAAGLCTATYVNITSTVTLDFTPLESLTNPATAYYVALLNEITVALNAFFSNNIGNAFHAVVVIELRSGSVLATFELQIDANKTDNAEGLAARAYENLLTAGQLSVNGTNRPVPTITIGNVTLSDPNSLCEVFFTLTTCPNADDVCVVNNGIPSCGPASDDDNVELIIGLGVGIPLFFIVVIVIAALIYICVRRQRSTAASEQRAEASEHRFPSIFAGQLATKGSWGAAQRYHMYSPDNVSVSHGSDSSGEGQLLKGRRQGRSDFQDSAWYDNRGGASASVVAPSSPRRDDGNGTEAATSNFSWEYMFRLLAPYRGGFEIQRPNVDVSPNPAYTPRSRGPRPDSMA